MNSALFDKVWLMRIQHFLIGIQSPTVDCRPPATSCVWTNGRREREIAGLLPTC